MGAFSVVVRRTSGVLFGEEAVGALADVVYGPDARYVVRIKTFLAEEGFHEVESLSVGEDRSLNFATGASEEAFTDIIDLSLLHRQRKLQILVSPCQFCPHCSLQVLTADFSPRSPLCGVSCGICSVLFHGDCMEATERLVCRGCAKLKRKRPPLSTDSPSSSSLVHEVAAEFLDLQDAGRTRRFAFMGGAEYLREVCQDNVAVALQSLRACTTNGVLSWSSDSENVKLLKRVLSPSSEGDLTLVVAVLEVHPVLSATKGRAREVFRLPALAARRTFGFVVVRSEGKVALFGSRASHARSLDELWDVVTEEGPWKVLDERSKTVLVQKKYRAEYGEYQTKQGTRQVLNSIDEITNRQEFHVRNYRLVQMMQPDNFIAEYIASPARLLLGFALRLLQRQGTRLVLLEIALPISDHVKHHGQGRKVEVVLRSRAATASDGDTYMPLRGDRVLEMTSNASAYKIYRAFGFGEHLVFNRLPGANQQPEYLYPVLGCVLETSEISGGVTREQILHVATRRLKSLEGVAGWLPTLVGRDESGVDHSVVAQVRDFDFQETTTEERKFLQELHLFEQVLDKVSPGNLGVSEEDLCEGRDHALSCVSSVASTSAPSTPVLAKNKDRSLSLMTASVESDAVRRSCRLASKAKDRELTLSRQSSYFLRS